MLCLSHESLFLTREHRNSVSVIEWGFDPWQNLRLLVSFSFTRLMSFFFLMKKQFQFHWKLIKIRSFLSAFEKSFHSNKYVNATVSQYTMSTWRKLIYLWQNIIAIKFLTSSTFNFTIFPLYSPIRSDGEVHWFKQHDVNYFLPKNTKKMNVSGLPEQTKM